MAAPNWKRYLKTLLKFVISGAALYVVFLNIDWIQTRKIFLSADIWMLLIATIIFIVSKTASAYRLDLYFRNIDLVISAAYNVRLYWVGMFYNLFLPGGIGGDGYKVYILNKQYQKNLKSLVSATLLDRVSGLVALLFLTGIGYLFIPHYFPPYVMWLVIACLILMYPVYYFLLAKLFKMFTSSFWPTNFYSLFVQGLQVVCAYYILLSLGVSDKFFEYLVLFLISSMVAVLPFTIGGVGARELTFILGYQYLAIDQNIAVAFSFLFFAITAVTSSVGGFLSARE